MNALRVGVVLPHLDAPIWIARMLEQIRDSISADVVMALSVNAPEPSGFLYDTYFKLDRRYFRPAHSPWGPQDVRPFLKSAQLIGDAADHGPDTIEALGLDVILNLTADDLPASTFASTRYGIWSLRCNDMRVVAGSEFGWLELLNDEHLMHCVIESRRGESIQAVARSVLASNPESFTHNQQSFLWRASALVVRTLDRLHAVGETELYGRAEVLKPASRLPRLSVVQIGRLVLKQAFRAFETRVWRRWFPQRWALMAGVRDGKGLPGLSDLKLMIPPRGLFWADPFLFERQGRVYAIFEEYVYRDYRAHISVAEIRNDGTLGESRVALKRPYHLSYPFVFEHGGELYMIPETGQNRTIEIYRCARVPDRWVLEKTLMRDVRAVDATLVEHANLWWMFVNLASEGGSTWDELHVFYSDSPLTDRWIPHPMNPVISDVRSARPAGRIFRQDGSLIRPSQDSSVRYGYALNLNRIKTLTTSEYEEELLERLEPSNNGFALAVHTFSFLNDLVMVDVMTK